MKIKGLGVLALVCAALLSLSLTGCGDGDPRYRIVSSAGAGGTITPSGEIIVTSGQDQSYTVVADEGYQISDVIVDEESQGAISEYTFADVNSEHAISASFVAVYEITSSAGDGGSITPLGALIVAEGSDQPYAIEADDGYAISDVLVDEESQGAISEYTFNSVTADHTITASFSVALKLYGATVSDFAEDPGTDYLLSDLVQLDPQTGALISVIGPIGYRVNGLEYDHTTDKLYAVTSKLDPNNPRILIVIDMETGAGTPVSPGDQGNGINNLTVNSAGELFTWTSNRLVLVDKATGVFAPQNSADFDPTEHGLAFDSNDDLFVVATLEKSTPDEKGVVFQIKMEDSDPGEVLLYEGFRLGKIDQIAHHGDFHPVTGEYWGIDTTMWWADPENERAIVKVDIDAIAITGIMATVDYLHNLTFAVPSQ